MSCLFCMTKLTSMIILIAYCVYLLVNLKSSQRQCMFCSENLSIFYQDIFLEFYLMSCMMCGILFVCTYVCLP